MQLSSISLAITRPQGPSSSAPPPVGTDNLLLEDGSALLLETGELILLETA